MKLILCITLSDNQWESCSFQLLPILSCYNFWPKIVENIKQYVTVHTSDIKNIILCTYIYHSVVNMQPQTYILTLLPQEDNNLWVAYALISDTVYPMEEAQLVNQALTFDLSLPQILFLPIKLGCRKKKGYKLVYCILCTQLNVIVILYHFSLNYCFSKKIHLQTQYDFISPILSICQSLHHVTGVECCILLCEQNVKYQVSEKTVATKNI